MAARFTPLHWAAFGFATSVLLMALKSTAFALTASSAILSDAIESSINLVTSGFALYAVWLSQRPRDREHPYGHGKIEYLSAGLEGALVLSAAVAILVVSGLRLRNPQPLESLGLGAGLMALISLVALGAGTAMVRAGRALQSPSVEADGVHIRSDGLTSFGAMAGVALVLITGEPAFDALAAFGLALFLLVDGVRTLRSAVGGVLDEASPALLEDIAATLRDVRQPGWLAPHHAKVHRLGQSIHIDMHLVFPRYWDLARAHAATEAIDEAFRTRFGERTEAMVHMEPCTPTSCNYCEVADCPIRSAPFRRSLEWNGALISATRRATLPDPDPTSAAGDANETAR